MVVTDTVNPAGWVHSKGLIHQSPFADDAAETGRVVHFPTSLQDLTVHESLKLYFKNNDISKNKYEPNLWLSRCSCDISLQMDRLQKTATNLVKIHL